MKIYLVRHGESEDHGLDDLRPLNTIGKQHIMYLAQKIANLGIHVEKINHSPKLRAVQTAELLRPSITLNQSMQVSDELAPLASVETFADDLNLLKNDMLFVGHLPFMGKLTSKLVIGNADFPIVSFVPGTMVALEKIGDQRWIICWILSPELLSPK